MIVLMCKEVYYVRSQNANFMETCSFLDLVLQFKVFVTMQYNKMLMKIIEITENPFTVE